MGRLDTPSHREHLLASNQMYRRDHNACSSVDVWVELDDTETFGHEELHLLSITQWSVVVFRST